MMYIMYTYRANEARVKLRDILTAAEKGKPSAIMRYDTPTAAVVPWDWYLYALSFISAGAPGSEEAALLEEAKAIANGAQT